ncbi:hypothetical protein BDV12DRAFT_102777 [Aspergillus spectabilis]
MANLARSYSDQGQWEEAKALEVQVLEIRKRILGPEHPSTLTIMANLASTYSDQGQWEEAKALKVQVLEIRKRILGREHPDTLTIMANLASTLYSQEDIHEAVALMEDCVRLRVRSLGPSHPHTIDSARSLTRWKETAESSTNQHQPPCQTENSQLIGDITQHSCPQALRITEAYRDGEPQTRLQGSIRPVTPLRAFLEARPLLLASRAGSSGMQGHDFSEVD